MTGSDSAPLLYGFTLGLVGAVNPCGFPLLPAYLAVGADAAGSEPAVTRLVRALGTGLLVTVAFLVVFGGIGLAFELGSDVAVGWLPWVMIPLGAGCVAAGGVSLAGRRVPLPAPGRVPLRGHGRVLGALGFGFAYALASLGCELPIFLGSVAGPFVRNGTVVGLAGGVSFALGMGLVIVAVSIAGVGVGRLRFGRLRAAQPLLGRVAGGVLVVVGAYLLLYWITALVDPLATPAPVGAVERAAADVAGWLSLSPRVTGAAIAAIVVAVLAAAARQGRRVAPPAAAGAGTAAAGIAGASPGRPGPAAPVLAGRPAGAPRAGHPVEVA